MKGGAETRGCEAKKEEKLRGAGERMMENRVRGREKCRGEGGEFQPMPMLKESCTRTAPDTLPHSALSLKHYKS